MDKRSRLMVILYRIVTQYVIPVPYIIRGGNDSEYKNRILAAKCQSCQRAFVCHPEPCAELVSALFEDLKRCGVRRSRNEFGMTGGRGNDRETEFFDEVSDYW